MLRYLPFLLILAVWIYAFIDCLNTPETEVRKLPKVVWVIIILLFGQVLVGPVAWFAVGRPRRNAPYGATRPDERSWVAPDDNPEFLKSINNGGAPPSGSGDDEQTGEEPGGTGGGDSRTSGSAGEGGTGTDAAAAAAADDGREPRPGAEPQEAELRRREEESRRRDNGAGGTDETGPQGG
jgi:phospholipase D-like protein